MEIMFRLLFLLYQFSIPVNAYTLLDKEKSFIKFEQWNMDKTGVLKFRFKTQNPYGLILYSDNSGTSSYTESYIALKLTYGKLEVTIQMGADDYKSNRRIAFKGSLLNDLNWHYVEIRRDAEHSKVTHITLDKQTESIVNDGEHSQLELNSGLFFGGIPQTKISMVDGSWMLEPR